MRIHLILSLVLGLLLMVGVSAPSGAQEIVGTATPDIAPLVSPTPHHTSIASDLLPVVHPLSGEDEAYRELLDLIGSARLVLIGEASHGTHEFYESRAQLTQWLIKEKGFTAVAIEGDWPDAYRVNLYIQAIGEAQNARESLDAFQRFPHWMWRNTVLVEFIDWLRQYNDSLPPGTQKVGFYGLDLYSLHRSKESVIRYLEAVDPPAASRARMRYGCVDTFDDPQAYGLAAINDEAVSCEEEVLEQVHDLEQNRDFYMAEAGVLAEDAYFYALQNAYVVQNAEAYYRIMYLGSTPSWNLRDEHMAATLEYILDYLERNGTAKVVVWAHNSHVGDARATEMGDKGQLNLGQLVREQYGEEDVILIGFTTYTGKVMAATNWDEAGKEMVVRPSLPGSYGELFHDLPLDYFLLSLEAAPASELLSSERLQRAIGVIYRPETERLSHYYYANLAEQFDVVIHIDKTTAVEALPPLPTEEPMDMPDTYPFGQ